GNASPVLDVLSVLAAVFTSSLRLLLAYHLFLFTHPAPSEFYTLSLHDALPISIDVRVSTIPSFYGEKAVLRLLDKSASRSTAFSDRKSTRLNSSHVSISYAVFCLKKKRKFAAELDAWCP